ncbi:hypothetical protein V8E36_008185, partial [Tilletia maclaganii]
SAVVMMDITAEAVHTTNADRVSFFGTAPGPGPALEIRLAAAVEMLWTPPSADLHFPAASAFLSQVLLGNLGFWWATL